MTLLLIWIALVLMIESLELLLMGGARLVTAATALNLLLRRPDVSPPVLRPPRFSKDIFFKRSKDE